MSDRIFALVWLLSSAGMLVVGWQIQSEYSYEPLGPRPFPLGIIGLMMLCSGLLLIRRPDQVDWPVVSVLLRLAVMVLALLCYAWWFEALGFTLASALLTCVLALLFRARFWAALISGLVMGVGLYYLFDNLLDVTLPVGQWLN